jgi:hypothetical protein
MKSILALCPVVLTFALGCSSDNLSVGKDPLSSGNCTTTATACPTDAPAEQSACTLGCNQTTLSCSFDCAHGQGYNTSATCDGQTWSVQRSLTACSAPPDTDAGVTDSGGGVTDSGGGACSQPDTVCPAYAPADKQACTLGCNQTSVSCWFDCAHAQGYNTGATCDGQKWTLSPSLTACSVGTADSGTCTQPQTVCPAYAPAAQSPCTLGCNQTQIQCSFDCAHGQGYNTSATCNGQTWTVVRSLTGCPAPTDGGSD